MAGDWIPMRCDLADDPAVISIAGALGMDEHAVVGRLHRLWSWANRQLTTGDARGVTESWIDRYVSATGFAGAMREAGWLTLTAVGVEFPRFDRWNSQGAKSRVLTAQRMRRSRQASDAKGDADRDAPRVTKTSPEKRREEKREEAIASSCPDAGRAGSGLAADGPTPSTALAPTKKPRARNPLYDAVAEVTGTDPATAGSLVGTVSAALAGASPPYTPDDVRDFGRRFWLLCPWAANERDRPTPKELQTHIGKLRAGPATVLPGRPKPAPTAFDRGAATEARVWGQIAEAIPELFQ